jgi:hypothetical protein
VFDFFYPRGGWARALHNTSNTGFSGFPTHQEIALSCCRGILPCAILWILYSGGDHLQYAWQISTRICFTTFFGNPAYIRSASPRSLAQVTGCWIRLLIQPFYESWAMPMLILYARLRFECVSRTSHNFMAMFTPEKTDWHGLTEFYHGFLSIGGIIPGIESVVVSPITVCAVDRPIKTQTQGVCRPSDSKDKKRCR